MSTEREDFQRAVVLLGWDGADLVPVLVDSNGQLYMVAKGEDGGGVLRTLAVDTGGQLVTVLRGQSGNYVDVDGSGFMTAVIKADHDGTPVTVGADAEGRLKMFIVDDIDAWGKYLEVGNAELAARLRGPIVAYDRRGQFVLQEDFEHGLGLFTVTGNGGHTLTRYTTQYVQGGGCARIQCNAGAVNWVRAEFEAPPVPGTTSIGVLVWLRFANFPTDWYVRLRHGDGTTFHEANIRGLYSDGVLYYSDSASVWQAFGTWGVGALDNTHWNFLKFTIDLVTDKYGYCIYNGVEYDLSAYDHRAVAAANLYTLVGVFGSARAAIPVNILFDCVALTVQE